MTNLDMNGSSNSLATLWIAPAKARVGRPVKTPTKMQLRIESIVMGVLAMDGGRLSHNSDGDLIVTRGLRMEELAAITGYTAAQIRPIMQRLVAAGVVRRTGNTRGTRYQAAGL